jgi:DNA-binding NarL/FixJ family response regulator
MSIGLKSFLVASSRGGLNSTELGNEDLPCITGTPHTRVITELLHCSDQLDAVPAVVILDVAFDPAARDIVTAARGNPRLKRTPFAALAMDADQAHVAELYDAGVNSVVPRPGDMDGLRAVIEQVRGYWLGANHVIGD